MAHAGEPATVQPDRQLPTQATSDNGPSSTHAPFTAMLSLTRPNKHFAGVRPRAGDCCCSGGNQCSQ